MFGMRYPTSPMVVIAKPIIIMAATTTNSCGPIIIGRQSLPNKPFTTMTSSKSRNITPPLL